MRTASGTRLGAGSVVVLLAFAAAAVWFWDSPLLWPFKLLVVMMHETGHALATLAVGGSVDRVHLTVNEGGACLSRLPPSMLGQVVVYSAGYVGSTLSALVLLLATLRWRLRRAVLAFLGLWLAVMGVLYAGDAFTLAFCGGTALVLALGARWLPEGVVDALNLFLATFSALYALADLKSDLWDSAVRAQSDAALLAAQTPVPAVVWAAVWTGVSLLLLALFVRVSVKAAGRRGGITFALR